MKPGDHLGHHEILDLIGSGGMGVVYRARDSRLDREVAIKVLPADLASDPERLARFRREARMLAALSHPNVAAIHGLDDEQERVFLVMELAPGETLAAAIDRGPMALDDVLELGIQMAAGLEAAHEKGIVHRDLKPANVKRGDDGQVKILDFGLARAFLGEEAGDPGDSDHSPTLTAAMTQAGVILGTAAYMSPEQARGHHVDARTDVWAFGVILWELLTGQRLFAGETVSDTLAMVLRLDPDWDALPSGLPPSLRRLLRRCLQRDRRQRLHHIADARIVLEEIKRDGTSAHAADESLVAGTAARPATGARTWLGWVACAVVVVAVLLASWLGGEREEPPPRPVRFDITVPGTAWLSSTRQNLALSPAGDLIVLAVQSPGGSQLYRRALDQSTMTPIAGTEDASTPFFSPDGQWIAFLQDDQLRKLPVTGGTPVDLCRTEWGGGVWTSDGRIIITRSYAGGLDVVPASGGEPRQLTRPEIDEGELGHWWPQLLPGEEWLIYTSWSTPIDRARIMAFSLESGEHRVLIEGGAFGRWSPTGHVLYVRGGQLLAAPFDRDRVEVTGPAEPVLDGVFLDANDGYSNLALAANGTLVYVEASVMRSPRPLVWVDRAGDITPLEVAPRHFQPPRLSPDGTILAETVETERNWDIWLHDLERGARSRFTFSDVSDFNPVWTPDGRTVIYNSEEPQFTIYRRPADGSAPAELLLREPIDTLPTSISPDGQLLVCTFADPVTDSDIWIVTLDGSTAPRPLVQTRFAELMATVSPDGRWLAYVSNESGRREVYAIPFPDGGARVQVSIDGGSQPAWSPRGDELFFRSWDGLMAVPIDRDRTTATTLAAGRPVSLFTGPFEGDWIGAGYEVDHDAQRFLMVHAPLETSPRTVRVVLNWFTELAGR